jgi:hypothetical protein
MENQIIIEALALADVENLREDQVAEIIGRIEKEPDRAKRSQAMKIIDLAFEIRTISAKNRNLKADLAFFGYKFFPTDQSKIFLRGIRKKISNRI